MPVWILLFLKDHILAIIITIACLSLMAYVGLLKHSNTVLRKEVGEYKMQIATLHAKEASLEQASEALTNKYKDALAKNNAVVLANTKILKEKLANEKELSAIRLSVNAVSLFNSSKGNTNGQESAAAIKGNDARTAALEKTLADLYGVVYENDANHLICIDTVKKWQNFWRDYEATIVSVNSGALSTPKPGKK